MTNIEKLARFIVSTGNVDRIMSALELAVKISVHPDNVRNKGSELCVREVCAGSNPSSLYQQVS